MDETGNASTRQENVLATVLAKKQRKTRHRGVLLLAPAGLNKSWRVRYRDPDTGKQTVKNLPPDAARNAEARATYATNLHSELRRRREDIARGSAPHRRAGELLRVAVDSAVAALPVKDVTRTEYRAGADALLEWADSTGVATVRQLTPGMLAKFPVWLVTMPKQSRAFGGKRGEMQRTSEPISRHTANKHIGSAKTVLNELRRTEVIRLTSDQIKDSLRKLKAPMELKPFLRPAQINSLISVSDDWREFLEFLLFTGCRLEEALGLNGSDVHAETNEIIVRAEIAKHGLARSLDVSHSVLLSKRMAEMAQRDRLFPYTKGQFHALVRRLIKGGAPTFSAHTLRRTCGTYIANGPWGTWRATKLLGHKSVTTSEKHYLGQIRIETTVTSIEEAMRLTSSIQAQSS